jgi:peptidoglycan/xylan/chitin deacetylase (PgdA/CDA1 family)
VILQYHHVSDHTPKSTSISPEQFSAHLQYLQDNNFNVVSLEIIVNAIKTQTPLPDKTVSITFDDAYIDILTTAKPILEHYNYPFTIFVNPAIIDRKSKKYLTWQQLKMLADSGVIIANHGLEHNSLARVPTNMDEITWLAQQSAALIKAETLIEQHTGQSWRYFAYPYGEYTPQTQAWLEEYGFVAFTQQSGAADLTTDLTIVPRFPASQPYDKLPSLRDKLNSLAFNVSLDEEAQKTVFTHNAVKSITIGIDVNDFRKNQLNCYVSSLGKQKIEWIDEKKFTIKFSKNLPQGRVRANCTAPSIKANGRYYWYSKPWFILNASGEWYPL